MTVSTRKHFSLMIALALTLTAVVSGTITASASDPSSSVPVALATLKPLANSAPVTEELAASKKVLVYFWASWCPDCREKLSAGSLGNLQKEFAGLKVLTVNTDRDEGKGKAFVGSAKIPLAVLRDDDRSVAKALHIFSVPSWAVLEKGEGGKWSARRSESGSDLDEIRNELRRIQ